MNNVLKAGAGTAVLDFPENYFPADGYSGIHDDMHAKVLLLEEGSVRGAIVTLELPSIRPWELTEKLRSFAADELNVPLSNLWVVMTHDLAAPHVPSEPGKTDMHMSTVLNAVKEACSAALSSFRPAFLRSCEGNADVNANRDVESVDGWWVGIEGTGPSDKTLSIMRFDDEDAKPIAVLYSYALKSSVLEDTIMSDGKKYASGEVTGNANRLVEEVLGCPVLFVMGAAGDQVPKAKGNYLTLDEGGHFRTVNLAEEGYTLLDSLASELADAITLAVKNCSATDGGLPLCFGEFSFTAEGQVSYPKDMPAPPVLHYDYPDSPPEDITVWYMVLRDTVLLGMKAEVTTPIFSEIKRSSPFAHTLMATLVNGGQGYVATDFDYDRYTYPGLKTPFRRGTDKKLIENTNLALKSLFYGPAKA